MVFAEYPQTFATSFSVTRLSDRYVCKAFTPSTTSPAHGFSCIIITKRKWFGNDLSIQSGFVFLTNLRQADDIPAQSRKADLQLSAVDLPVSNPDRLNPVRIALGIGCLHIIAMQNDMLLHL